MLKKLLVLSVLVALFGVIFRGTTKKGKIIQTRFGPVQGIISESRDGREFYEWLGIPYAKPPTGELRFASPQPAEAWDGVRDASSYGAKCAQLELFSYRTIGEEDCLFLNVHMPKLDSDNVTLPVMVYIHGGGYNIMSSDDFRPDYFMDEDVILIVINYRLNLFGFASTGDKFIRGNMGLKDQSFALKWVKENIESFGGNPDQITIFGESAGGGSVHYHLLSPMSKGLFHKAIAQSGVASTPWSFDTTVHAKLFTEEFAKAAKCPKLYSSHLLACLRSKSTSELLEAYVPQAKNMQVLKPHAAGQWFEPTIESVNDSETFLFQHPLSIVEQGKALRIPFLLGHVSSEGLCASFRFYGDPETMNVYESNFKELTLKSFEVPKDSPGIEEMADKIKEFYFPSNISTTQDKLDQYTKMFSDAFFNFHIHHVASVQRKFSPTYLYYFSRRGGPSLIPLAIFVKEDIPLIPQALFYFVKAFLNRVLFGILPRDYGTGHGDELAYLFYTPNILHIPKDEGDDYIFSKDLIKLWVSFAKNESVEFRGSQVLPLDKNGPLKYFELNESPQVVEEPIGDRITFLKSLEFLKYSY